MLVQDVLNLNVLFPDGVQLQLPLQLFLEPNLFIDRWLCLLLHFLYLLFLDLFLPDSHVIGHADELHFDVLNQFFVIVHAAFVLLVRYNSADLHFVVVDDFV